MKKKERIRHEKRITLNMGGGFGNGGDLESIDLFMLGKQ